MMKDVGLLHLGHPGEMEEKLSGHFSVAGAPPTKLSNAVGVVEAKSSSGKPVKTDVMPFYRPHRDKTEK